MRSNKQVMIADQQLFAYRCLQSATAWSDSRNLGVLTWYIYLFLWIVGFGAKIWRHIRWLFLFKRRHWPLYSQNNKTFKASRFNVLYVNIRCLCFVASIFLIILPSPPLGHPRHHGVSNPSSDVEMYITATWRPTPTSACPGCLSIKPPRDTLPRSPQLSHPRL